VVVSPFRFEDILEFWGSGCMKITGQNWGLSVLRRNSLPLFGLWLWTALGCCRDRRYKNQILQNNIFCFLTTKVILSEHQVICWLLKWDIFFISLRGGRLKIAELGTGWSWGCQ
jgi:hypothetical protein